MSINTSLKAELLLHLRVSHHLSFLTAVTKFRTRSNVRRREVNSASWVFFAGVGVGGWVSQSIMWWGRNSSGQEHRASRSVRKSLPPPTSKNRTQMGGQDENWAAPPRPALAPRSTSSRWTLPYKGSTTSKK